MRYDINIVNGEGTENVMNGTYDVSANVPGYDNSTIDPSSVTVVEGTNEYEFTIAATGTLTIHVTEDGTSTGTPVVGATFKRTDSAGTEYGTEVTTDASGNAVLNNVPFGTGAPAVYYKQLSSDGAHTFTEDVASVTLTASTQTVEVVNALPPSRTFRLTDANYDGLVLDGTLELSDN